MHIVLKFESHLPAGTFILIRLYTAFNNIVQYSDKFMHGIVSHSIVLVRSKLYCIVKLLLGGYNIIQFHA